jgi:chemotaxis protein methyltransferase CheR
VRQVAPWLSQEELALFNELFSSRFGLYFPEHKREILESRLLPRLRANHLQRFIDYYLLLQYDFQREVDALTQSITNNESYFFREIGQFEALQDNVLRGLLAEGPRANHLRILSAGCSSGEEPYTLNIYLKQQPFGLGSANLQIDGIDLDTERLQQANRAIYRPGSLRTLTREQIERYFTPAENEHFELRQPFRSGIKFSHGNILDLATYPKGAVYDALFCRNVLIYFSEPALKQAIEIFAQVVRPGGLLFLGHSESIIGLTQAFQAERLNQCIAYRRKA